MKIKRFVADNVRQALKMVREAQGPDAVILSNERVNGGVEIIAAVDYDESLIHRTFGAVSGEPAAAKTPGVDATPPPAVAPIDEAPADVAPPASDAVADSVVPEPPRVVWSQEPTLVGLRREMESMRTMLEQQLSQLAWTDTKRRNPVRARLLRGLCGMGLSIDLAHELADGIDSADPRDALRLALAGLTERIAVTDDGIVDDAGVVALVGPTGVGKTTTIAKLAARFSLRHGRDQLALVSTDTFRIGAQEQLMTFGRILGVAVHPVADERDLPDLIESLRDKRLVLVDTAGMSQRDSRLSHQLAMLQGRQVPIRLYLALAASSQSHALDEAVRFYGRAPLHGCILTKTDEACSLGGALSALLRHDLPLSYVTDGQRVPEDLHAARAKRTWLVKQAARLTRESGRLIEEEQMAMHFGEVAVNA